MKTEIPASVKTHLRKLRAVRRGVMKRGNEALECSAPADVRSRMYEACKHIVDEIDTQMRGLEFGWRS